MVGVHARLDEKSLPAPGEDVGTSSCAVERGFLPLLLGDAGALRALGEVGKSTRLVLLLPLTELSAGSI